MYSFGKTSKERLATCHPALQEVFNEVIKHFDCSILCGLRTEEEQNQAVHDGRSKVMFPDSKHNSKYEGQLSEAVDAAPYYPDIPHIRWDDKAGFYLFAGFVKGIAVSKGIKLRYGGDWDGDNDTRDQTFMDLPHFELPNPDWP